VTVPSGPPPPTGVQPDEERPTEERPPQTAEHWRLANRWLARGALLAAGFLAGALIALLVVLLDPTAQDAPKRPPTVTVTRAQTVTAQPTVPDVVGASADAAQRRMREAGYDSTVNEDSFLCVLDRSLCKVTASDPPAGTTLAAGETVTLTINRP
jgi:hypothetical protein